MSFFVVGHSGDFRISEIRSIRGIMEHCVCACLHFQTDDFHSMNYLRFLAMGYVLSVALQPLHATTDSERELDQLTKERDRALAIVAEPINKEYEAAITALMRKAALADDLDTAVRIKHLLVQFAENRDRAALVGKWGFLNKADGHTAVLDFNADKTISVEGKRLGVWEIKGKQMTMTHDDREIGRDSYRLPIQDGGKSMARTSAVTRWSSNEKWTSRRTRRFPEGRLRKRGRVRVLGLVCKLDPPKA